MNEANNTSVNDFFEGRCYKINKRLLSLFGLWPYQSSCERYIRIIVLIVVNGTVFIPLVLKTISAWNEIDIMIEVFSPLVTNCGLMMKTFNLACNSKKVKILLEETRENWESAKRHLPELKILQEYGERGRIATLSYGIVISGGVYLFLLSPMMAVIYDYFVPLNETRPYVILIPTDYKVDPDEYYYVMYIHGCSVIAMGTHLYIAHDTFYMVMSQHACGMMKILRIRLEIITRQDERFKVGLCRRYQEDVYRRQIIFCIETHKRIIKFVKLLESTCEWLLVPLVSLTMICISCTGARAVSTDVSTKNVIKFVIYILLEVIHLFCNTLPGHWIMNSSSMIRYSAYNCRWYSISPKSRKLLLFLIHRSTEPCIITAGKIYIMSMANFSCVLKTSASYFTLLTSVQ